MDTTQPQPRADASRRQRVALVSLAGGSLIFLAKLAGWYLTGSSAVLSDALESTVNVVAATFAVFALRFAAQPADRDHPYGHGKIEFVSAAFEGGLISFAAVMILYTAGQQLIVGPELRRLDLGLLIAAGAGAANLLLGAYVLREGRQLGSATLVADGKHILSDVWTTAGVILGLLLVRLTGLVWLDPIAALAVGGLLAWTGVRLVRESVGALLDQEDPELLQRLVQAFNESPVQGLGGVHRLRAIRSGDVVHVDAHLFVPEHWSVRQAHEAVTELERQVKERSGLVGELALHLDPCHDRVCSGCDLPACGIRREGFRERLEVTLEDAVGPASRLPHHRLY
ncbi:cation diffusion facilitator family transporter [Vulgatibacter sp.]|uniref:cation diffusion facilitator family transporter n=1 Tax=Vulgatibacter sp. TaxID=1971226 RepID=UPI00356AC813